jgi:UTP-glucose-1-phosphate uridylyltransferase
MSFQAYLDKVEELTGMTPEQFVAMAKKKKLTRHSEIIAWLQQDHGLGLGHARAIAHVILHGETFTVRQTTGPHRDESGTLNLKGKKAAKKKRA